MLENTFAIVTSCLPAIRLFVAKQGNMTNNTSNRYYGNGVSSNTADDLFGRGKKGIPLDTLTETHNGEVVEDTAAIFMKQDFVVESRHLR